MSPLITAQNLSKAYGTETLFERITFNILQGDRIGLIGPNGAGKSTLMKILAGIEEEDSGELTRKLHLQVGYASQVPNLPDLPLEELLVSSSIARENGGDLYTRARQLLSKMQFEDFSQRASTLSGGWRKRLDIARALMGEPDLLLLDEPTNHLDLEGILWLEKFLAKENFSYLLISHDRYFLESCSNKVVELNRCYEKGIFSAEGSLSSFMEQKEAYLKWQRERQKGLSSAVRQEVEWLSRSPKARTTKSLSRMKNAYKLIDELGDVKERNKVAKVDLSFSASERKTRKLLVATNICKSLGNKELFHGIKLTLSPGSRVGIVGKNGTGKTTLLRLLAGELPPDKGTIKRADNLKITYFDQHRESVDPEATLKEALSPNGDYVTYLGRPLHVNGWAKKFLFDTDRMGLPVKCLSGGERARILIARLILEPADLLFLDEPTNDLDISTLEVIEESLMEFPGAVVLITHDRCMMDRICTTLIGLGEGLESNFFAEYSQWEEACRKREAEKKVEKPPQKKEREQGKKALSYSEKKELEAMEEKISRQEEKIAELLNAIESSKGASPHESYSEVAEEEKRLNGLYDRWQGLLDRL